MSEVAAATTAMPNKSGEIDTNPYTKSTLTHKISLKVADVSQRDANVRNMLREKISEKCGRCSIEGFIHPDPQRIDIQNYSMGMVNGEYMDFYVTYNCDVCLPVENTIIKCRVYKISFAGIHAVVEDDGVVPIDVKVARDYVASHFERDLQTHNIQENSVIYVSVIGVRFELNDPFVSVIGKLYIPRAN
jgi:hypothetical protein